MESIFLAIVQMGISFPWWSHDMETLAASSALCDGNLSITGVTGWLPLQRASIAETFPGFRYCSTEQVVEQTVDVPVIWESLTLMWRLCNV